MDPSNHTEHHSLNKEEMVQSKRLVFVSRQRCKELLLNVLHFIYLFIETWAIRQCMGAAPKLLGAVEEWGMGSIAGPVRGTIRSTDGQMGWLQER